MSRSEIKFGLLVYDEWCRAVLGHPSFRKLQHFACVGFYGVSGIHLVYDMFCDESDSFVKVQSFW